MDVTEIKKLMEILNSTDVKEISLETDGTKILLKKDKNVKNKVNSTKVVEEKTEIPTPQSNIKSLISLNVGKFYIKDKTGKEFIKVGDKIEKDQVIGYIESIGVKTDIKSDKKGIVKEILLKNGDIVQFGQEIVKLEV